ncbi:MAG: hypothetical protein ACFE0J_15260 [Elainellaceae cyanobacterium]
MPKFRSPSNYDFREHSPTFQQEMERLYRLTVYGRWAVVILLWLVIGSISLWALRDEIALWVDYFTWTAVRYSLAFNPLAAMGLSICFGATIGLLVWQSRNILMGVSLEQTRRLEKQLIKIRQQGSSHPLWAWICRDKR